MTRTRTLAATALTRPRHGRHHRGSRPAARGAGRDRPRRRHHRARPHLHGGHRPGRRDAVHHRRRPVPAGVRERHAPGAGDPHDQRLRRQQGRPGRARPRLRPARLRRPVVHGPGLPGLRLQDHARRPGVRRARGVAAHLVPRRHRHGDEGRRAVRDAGRRRPRRHRPRGRRAPRRPARRHGGRVVRRADPVRDGQGRQAAGRDRPDHHLERPAVLPGTEQHLAHRRDAVRAGHREDRLDVPVLRRGHRRRRPGRHASTPRATSAARTSAPRRARPRCSSTPSATPTTPPWR